MDDGMDDKGVVPGELRNGRLEVSADCVMGSPSVEPLADWRRTTASSPLTTSRRFDQC
jgi:hypothetical protein